jgi:hypothetical protein
VGEKKEKGKNKWEMKCTKEKKNRKARSRDLEKINPSGRWPALGRNL